MNTLQRAKQLVQEIEKVACTHKGISDKAEKELITRTDILHRLIDTAMEAGELINKGVELLKEVQSSPKRSKCTKIPQAILDDGDYALLEGRRHKCARCGTDEDMTDYYLTEWTENGNNASEWGGVTYCESCVLAMLKK